MAKDSGHASAVSPPRPERSTAASPSSRPACDLGPGAAVHGRLPFLATLVVANAGHPPPLIARKNGAVEQIGSTGPVAGILDDSRWTSVVKHLAPSDTLLLYTDGAIEANDFGVEGVAAALRQAATHRTSRAVANAVASAVRAHGGIDDDLTLMVARR